MTKTKKEKILKLIKNKLNMSDIDRPALDLLFTIQKLNPTGLYDWVENGDTIKLRHLAEPYKKFSIYVNRNGPLPFFNDVCAIDSAWLWATEQNNHRG